MSNDLTEAEVEIFRLADAGDIGSAIARLAELDERGEKVDAALALALVERAWAAKPHKPKLPEGRPPTAVEDRLMRALDGARSIVGEKPSKHRSQRALERCRAEARALYGSDLQELGGKAVFKKLVQLSRNSAPRSRCNLLRLLFQVSAETSGRSEE